MLALLVASATALISCSDYPYTHEEAAICAIDGDSLIVLVTRETGTRKTNIGPCPKVDDNPQHLHTNTLVYSLVAEGDPQIFQGPSFDLAGGQVNAAMWRRIAGDLKIPQTRRLFDVGSDFQPYEAAGVSATQSNQLKKLGFDLDDAYGFIDQPDGRWYLGLDLEENTAHLACIEQDIFVTKSWAVLSGTIWNHAQHQLISLNDSEMDASSNMPFRYPRAVTIWNYKTDTTRVVQLRPPHLNSAVP